MWAPFSEDHGLTKRHLWNSGCFTDSLYLENNNIETYVNKRTAYKEFFDLHSRLFPHTQGKPADNQQYRCLLQLQKHLVCNEYHK